jgi:hypothetical protein
LGTEGREFQEEVMGREIDEISLLPLPPRLRVNQPESSRGDAENTEKRVPNEKAINSQLSTLFSVCPVFSVVTLSPQLRALTLPAR